MTTTDELEAIRLLCADPLLETWEAVQGVVLAEADDGVPAPTCSPLIINTERLVTGRDAGRPARKALRNAKTPSTSHALDSNRKS